MSDIRFAVFRDLAAIREIWSAVFTEDSPAERDRFLKTVRLCEECMLACIDGKPVSMAFFLPAVLHVNGGEYTARYLYAAATLPVYRGRGIFRDLLNTALAFFKQRGTDACFLNPAEPSLVEYYRRFGFEPAFFCRTVCGGAHIAQLPLIPLSGTEYIAFRQTLLPREYVAWDHRLLKYAASYAKPVRIGDGVCALFVKDNTTLRVIELLGVPSEQQAAVCGALAWHQGCETFCARVSAQTGDCFGMLLPLAESIPLNTAPHMGLAFD